MDSDFPELPQAACDEVRHRVLGEIRRRRRVRNAVRTIAGVAVCVAVVFTAVVVLRRPAALPGPPMLARSPGGPPPVLRSLPVRHWRAPRRKLPRTQPLMVRLETDDPNVVILWMVD